MNIQERATNEETSGMFKNKQYQIIVMQLQEQTTNDKYVRAKCVDISCGKIGHLKAFLYIKGWHLIIFVVTKHLENPSTRTTSVHCI